MTADKIEGLVAIENALGTIEWNATNAGRLKQIPEALRISEADASRFATWLEISATPGAADGLLRKLEDFDSSYNVAVNVRYTFKTAFNPANLEARRKAPRAASSTARSCRGSRKMAEAIIRWAQTGATGA